MHNQSHPVRILLIDDASEAEQLLNILRKGGHATRPKMVSGLDELEDLLSEQTWDLILAKPSHEDIETKTIIDTVAAAEQDIPVVIITDTEESEDRVVQMMRMGIQDVIVRSRSRQLLCIIERELAGLEIRRDKRRSESFLRDHQRRSEELLENSNDAVAYALDGMHVHVNPIYVKTFGYEDVDDFTGLPMLDLVDSGDQERFRDFIRELQREKEFVNRAIEFTAVKNGGKTFPVKLEFTSATFDGEDCCQITARDLSQNREIKRLSLITQQDALTALYSHKYFLDLLDRTVSAAVNDEKRAFLLYIELDKFNQVKEKIGITTADMVIRNIASVLHRNIGADDKLARYGDATFTLIMPGNELGLATELANTLREAIESHICEVDEQSVAVTCSIGLSHITETTSSAQKVLSHAAEACYQAARDGGNRIVAHKPSKTVKQDHFDENKVIDDIRAAIRNPERLKLIFQPVVSLKGETEETYSVFLRVQDSAGNRIETDTVFRIADENDIAIELDEWVLQRVFEMAAERNQRGVPTRFFVKLSEQAIKDERITLFIATGLKKHNLPPELLYLQISETSVVTQLKLAKAFVQGMKTLHCGTALEHFGSGLNSFGLLKHLDVDILKIDGSFSPDLAHNEDNQLFLRDIIGQAGEHEKKVIIPWIEDAQSLAILWQLGADYAQGNYIQEAGEELTFDFAESG